MGLQNLSKSVKICQSYWEKFAATFFMPHSVYCSCRYDRQKMRKWDKHLRNKLRHYATSASARCIPAICQAYTSCVINPVQRSIKLFYFVYKIGSETDFWEGYFFTFGPQFAGPWGTAPKNCKSLTIVQNFAPISLSNGKKSLTRRIKNKQQTTLSQKTSQHGLIVILLGKQHQHNFHKL